MSFPVPSEERTVKEKWYRAPGGRSIDTSFAQPYLHNDEHRKLSQQETFANSEHGLFRRFDDRSYERPYGLKHVPEPARRPHVDMRRPAHRIPPLDQVREAHVTQLFPSPVGMTHRPDVVAAQEVIAQAHGIYEKWPPESSKPGGKRIIPMSEEERQRRSEKSDLSLWHGGVRKFQPPAAQTPEPWINGFKGFAVKELEPRKSGKGLVTPTNYDPLGFKKMYGRTHYGL